MQTHHSRRHVKDLERLTSAQTSIKYEKINKKRHDTDIKSYFLCFYGIQNYQLNTLPNADALIGAHLK